MNFKRYSMQPVIRTYSDAPTIYVHCNECKDHAGFPQTIYIREHGNVADFIFAITAHENARHTPRTEKPGFALIKAS